MDEFIKTAGSQGLILQEYQGKYSLAAAWEGKEGKVNMKWAKEQKGKDEYAEKATPIKVSLGDRETAIATLKALLGQLGAAETGPMPDDDVPF